MIIFKRKHLSIKWGIFAGILVFLAILLLLLFLLQTVYLDDIYKAAKKNTLNKRAKENGGGFTEEFAGDIQRDPFELLTKNGELSEKPTGDRNEAGQPPQNENTGNGVSLDQTPPSGIAQESMVSVRILTISSTPYLTIVSARLTPVNATVQMIRQELI